MNVKIAIIGAGWTGIGCLKQLLEAGYNVVVYEQNDDIGGTWHRKNHYAGLKIHGTAHQVEYPDYPLPKYINKSERITAVQVLEYLRSYARYKGFYPHIKFSTKIKKVSYNSLNKKTILLLEVDGTEVESEPFDYVVYTHGYCNRTIPKIDNIENFKGEVYHSLAVNEQVFQQIITTDKKTIVLGGSKTATDFILKFNDSGYRVTWLLRGAYTFFRFDAQRNFVANDIEARKWKGLFNKFAYIFGYLIGEKFPLLLDKFWRLTHITHTYSTQRVDFKRFHLGAIDDNQMKILRKLYKEYAVIDGIKTVRDHTVITNSGKKLQADVIICCTGSSGATSLIDFCRDNQPINIDAVFRIYRGKVMPQMPRLIFTAYNTTTFGVVNGLNHGNWLLNFIKLNADEKHLLDNSKTYDYPFLKRQILFDSSRYYIQEAIKSVSEYIDSKELTKRQLVKVFFELFFSSKPANPLNYKMSQTLVKRKET